MSSSTESSLCYRKEKIEQIQALLKEQSVDLWQLRELALSRGGFLSPAVRKQAWHKLLDVDISSHSSLVVENGGDGDPHRALDANLVALTALEPEEMDLIRRDVGRSAYFRFQRSSSCISVDSSSSLADNEDNDAESNWEQRNVLASIIISALAPNAATTGNNNTLDQSENHNLNSSITIIDEEEKLHYYQGLHDIASVIFHNIEDPMITSQLLNKVASFYLRDATRENFDQISTLFDTVFFPLLYSIDEAVHDFLLHCGCSADMFLPWFITWFSHDVRNVESASRLFDAFLASHPLMPIYLSVAIVVHPTSRRRIFATECCVGMMQVTMKQILDNIGSDFEDGNGEKGTLEDTKCERTTITFQNLLDDAISFMKKIHPGSLLSICKKYQNEKATAMLKKTESIQCLKPAPTFCLASSAPSDSAQRQRQHVDVQEQVWDVAANRLRALSPRNYILSSPNTNGYLRAKIASGRVDSSSSFADADNSSSNDNKTFFDLDKSPTGTDKVKAMAGKLLRSAKKKAAAASRRN